MIEGSVIDYQALLVAALGQYLLSPRDIHGVSHWARVLENGRRLARDTGADPEVLQCFAILHDSRRYDNNRDLQHGPRAAEFAATLRGSLLRPLDGAAFELLRFAISEHTRGSIDGDVTVCTCWDADRLDLYRVGIVPSPKWLCTSAARDQATIDWAVQRSLQRAAPRLLTEEWGWRG